MTWTPVGYPYRKRGMHGAVYHNGALHVSCGWDGNSTGGVLYAEHFRSADPGLATAEVSVGPGNGMLPLSFCELESFDGKLFLSPEISIFLEQPTNIRS